MHMQIIVDHIARVVRPALRKYVDAENSLTAAVLAKDSSAIDTARQDVMLAARQAATELHHLSDFVLKEPSPTLQFTKIEDVRKAVDVKCVYSRTTSPVQDVGLLRDVADAFKHHRPDRANTKVRVSTDILSKGTGFGGGRFGEGKYGGIEQVVVTTTDGDRRALSSILQNVFDAWISLLGQDLPPRGQY
jgi:hypothetical protein